jgi:hypothetical protein
VAVRLMAQQSAWRCARVHSSRRTGTLFRVTVRDLVVGDVGWAAEVMAARREMYAAYSPVFWRPRHGITERHASFLERQLQAPNTVALRTRNAFVIAQCRDREGVIDDFAIDGEGTWADDGRKLLDAAWYLLAARGMSAARVVTAQADQPKVAMLVVVGLQMVQQWWVKPIEAVDAAGLADGRIDGPGFLRHSRSSAPGLRSWRPGVAGRPCLRRC